MSYAGTPMVASGCHFPLKEIRGALWENVRFQVLGRKCAI